MGIVKMKIRKMMVDDRNEVLEMMKDFYASDAVIYKSPVEVMEKDIDDCLSDLPFVEGYVFIDDDRVCGYSMVSKSYSTEYGGICIWIEDLFIKDGYRGKGIGTKFFKFIEDEYKEAVRFKLEVESNNERAIEVYKRCGYKESLYMEMSKER